MTKNTVLKIDKAFYYFEKFVIFSGGVLLVLMFVSLFLQVLLRYVIDRPIIWIEEFATYCMGYLTVWVASSVFRQGDHLNVEVILDKLLPDKASYIMKKIVIPVICLILLLVFFYYGWEFALRGRGRFGMTGTFEQYRIRLLMPSGFLFMILQVLNNLFRSIYSLTTGIDEKELTVQPEILESELV